MTILRSSLSPAIFLLVLHLLASGCTPSSDETAEHVIGRWTRAEPGVSGRVEFARDGRFALTDQSHGTITGTWKSSATGPLTVTVTGSDIMRDRVEPIEAETFVVEARVEGETLHLTVGGETEVYRRHPGDD